MRGQCGAQPVPLEGSATPVCVRQADAHQGQDHWDGADYRWPACSQHCLIGHVHGRYRLHAGIATGPSTAAARAPKATGQSRPRTRCKICLARAELAGGICKDRAACEARMPPLL